MAYTRISPGVYRNTNGQVINSAQRPGARPAPTQQNPAARNRARDAELYRGAIDSITKNGFQRGTDQFNQQAKVIRDIGGKYGYNWQKHIGADWSPTPPPAQTAEPAPTAPAPMVDAPPVTDYLNYQSPMTKSLLDAMKGGVGTMSAYEPQNFQGSPLYQFQKDKGMQDLQKLMASRGLTNSGAEIQANSNFLSELNAQEAEKQRQYAESDANRAQSQMQYIANFDQTERNNLRDQLNTDVTRRMQQQQFDATRQDGRQRLMTDFLSNVLQMQSNNPIAQLAYQGLGQQSDYTAALMKAISGNVASNYPRSYGGGTPPQAPNNSLDIARILMNYGNNAGNNDLYNGIWNALTGR